VLSALLGQKASKKPSSDAATFTKGQKKSDERGRERFRNAGVKSSQKPPILKGKFREDLLSGGDEEVIRNNQE